MRGLLAVALSLLFPLVSQAQNPLEYKLKTALVYKIVQLVSWPGAQPRAQFTVGVLGDGAFVQALTMLQGKEAHGRPIVVRRIGPAESGACQVVVITAGERDRLGQVLDAAGRAPVLLIGESDGFLDRGGMVSFSVEGQKLRFAVNQEAMRAAGMGIDPSLVELAARTR